MGNSVAKDNSQVQKDRICRLGLEYHPNFKIEFFDNALDPDCPYIRFRVRDAATGKIVGSIKQDREPLVSELADKDDEGLLQMITTLTRGSTGI